MSQVLLYDFAADANLLISRSVARQPGNGGSDSPVISADGRFIAYRSSASDIVPGDTNDQPDIFLYDRLAGATLLLSVNQAAFASANDRSFAPAFSADGRILFFQSSASDLAPGDFNHATDHGQLAPEYDVAHLRSRR